MTFVGQNFVRKPPKLERFIRPQVCFWLLITEFVKEVSSLLPNPCHFQDYDQSMFPSGPCNSDVSRPLWWS